MIDNRYSFLEFKHVGAKREKYCFVVFLSVHAGAAVVFDAGIY